MNFLNYQQNELIIFQTDFYSPFCTKVNSKNIYKPVHVRYWIGIGIGNHRSRTCLPYVSATIGFTVLIFNFVSAFNKCPLDNFPIV